MKLQNNATRESMPRGGTQTASDLERRKDSDGAEWSELIV